MSSTARSEDVENHQLHEKPNIKGDRLNFLILTCLYVLQGSVFGIALAIPLVLQKRNVTYQDQATYNIIMYSYAFKILWAPIVDSIHWPRMGRRKSWVVPMQYFIGIILLIISLNVDSLLGTEDGSRRPNIPLLTVTFFACLFFSSTQDIAVDGWSLTIFQRKNVGYSAPSQSVGMTFGFFLTNLGFIVLDSKDFCNLFRSTPVNYGFVKFADFLFYWALFYLVTTTLVLVFKKEKNVEFTKMRDEQELSIGETYLHLWRILKIPSVQKISLFMLIWHIAHAPVKNVATLKILDAGIRRDVLVLFGVPAFPLCLILSFALNRFMTGPRPLKCFFILYVLKVVNCVVYAAFVYFLTESRHEHYQTTATWYYWPLMVLNNVEGVTGFLLMMVFTAFFARVSDPRFGGVYLTLLNSVNNIGSSWPSTICLWLVDILTIKSCTTDGQCHTVIDGFYVEVVACTSIGALWMLFWGQKYIECFGKMNVGTCMVERKPTVVKDPLLSVNSAA